MTRRRRPFATDTLAPPTALAATGGASVGLTWTPTVDTYATGYSVWRGSASGGPYTSIGTVTPGTASSTTNNPAVGTWYYVLRSTFGSWSSVNSNQASASVTAAVSTAFAACTTQAPDTTGAGDNNGYEGNPARACVNDSSDATDTDSGTTGSAVCGTGSVPAATRDRHRFWGFAHGVPGTAQTIAGIRVRADLGMGSNGGTTNVCAQLSWDGGTSWTALQSLALTAMGETTYTFGGTADTWGRTWTTAQLGTAQFRVRLVNASTQTSKDFDLDFVAVSVTYHP